MSAIDIFNGIALGLALIAVVGLILIAGNGISNGK